MLGRAAAVQQIRRDVIKFPYSVLYVGRLGRTSFSITATRAVACACSNAVEGLKLTDIETEQSSGGIGFFIL